MAASIEAGRNVWTKGRAVSELWASPTTLLGQVQRGRGLGWLRATESPAEGKRALQSCVQADPRWDRQVEARVDYYATLALALNVPAAEIAHMRGAADAAHDLADSVAVQMAKRGDLTGLPALKARLVSLEAAEELLPALARLEAPDALSGVPEILCAALTDDEVIDLVRYARNEVPWSTWARENTRIASALAVASDRETHKSAPPLAADARIADLLATGWPSAMPRRLRHRFRHELSTADVQLVRETATGGTGYGRVLAMRILTERADPFVIPTAAQLFADNTVGGERAAAIRYIEALDPTATLPLAREWFDLGDDRAGVAAGIFALHAEPADLPRLRPALGPALQQREFYVLCDLIEALGRHPDLGPFPELVEVFERAEYSYARKRAARVLAQSEPTFGDTFGFECLWDCEAAVRQVGAAHVSTSTASRPRLAELVQDGCEDPEVREAAAGRLSDASRP